MKGALKKQIEQNMAQIALVSDEEKVDNQLENMDSTIKSRSFLPIKDECDKYGNYFSNQVTIDFNKILGRHLRANCDLNPGQVIAMESPILSFAHCDEKLFESKVK